MVYLIERHGYEKNRKKNLKIREERTCKQNLCQFCNAGKNFFSQHGSIVR